MTLLLNSFSMNFSEDGFVLNDFCINGTSWTALYLKSPSLGIRNGWRTGTVGKLPKYHIAASYNVGEDHLFWPYEIKHESVL